MISESCIKKYCCEDISLIENYDKAIKDKTQTWHCHHKAEILPCGRFTTNDLKKFNLYYDRPANELIFLTRSIHRSLHWTGRKVSLSTRKKLSEIFKVLCLGEKNGMYGKKHSEESKQKMSVNLRGKTAGKKNGMYGKVSPCRNTHWFNNGKVCVMTKECPEGFVRGRLKNN